MRILLALLAVAAMGAVGWSLRLRRRLRQSERDRRRAADELNRRLSELFSLQELSFILSGSLQLDRIVEQVVRYAMRFLDAQGALVALAPDGEAGPAGGGGGRGDRPLLRVTAADGTLAGLAGRSIGADDPGLVARSLGRERLELVRDSGGQPTRLVEGVDADSAAAVPLRAHGVVVGTLVIANPRGGAFASEDIRLLSTVATHAAIVIANARFFEMVRHAKEQWETAFDSLSEGIAVVDDAGRVRRANRSFAALLGAPIPGVIGRELVAALVGASPPLVDLLAAARAGDRVQPIVLRSTTLGRAIRVTAARIPAPGGAHDQSLVVLVEDVTDQQAMEAHLIQSEKLAAVGQLVSGVAHELNNPLTSIAGLSEFLLEQKELGTKDRGHLRVIHEQADRAGRIVRNLLTFAHKGPAEQAPVDLNDVIQRTLILMSYDLKLKDVTIEKHLAPLPAVLGDRRALQQVVLNLLNNAAQAVTTNPPGRPLRRGAAAPRRRTGRPRRGPRGAAQAARAAGRARREAHHPARGRRPRRAPHGEGAVRTRGALGGGGAERAARARPRAHPGVRPDPRGRAGAGARSPIRGAAGGDAARSPRPGAGRPGGGAAAGGKGAGAARRALRAQAFQPARSA